MKANTIKFKQTNMLCCRCMANVVKSLSHLRGIEELEINLDSKKIKIVYHDETISNKMIKDIVNDLILTGKVKDIYSKFQ